MAKTRLDIGNVVDFLTKHELDDSLTAHADRIAQAEVRGIKYFRMPPVTGTVFSGTIGGFSGSSGVPGIQSQFVSPESGYAWSVTRISVSGLFNANSGTTQDIVGIYRNSTNNPPVAQLSANSPMIMFNKLGCVMRAGDFLVMSQIKNQAGNTNGTLAATGNLTLAGEAIEVPEEMLGKLA